MEQQVGKKEIISYLWNNIDGPGKQLGNNIFGIGTILNNIVD